MKRRALVFGMVLVTALSSFVFVSTVAGSLWYSSDTEVHVPFGDIIVREVRPEDKPLRLKIPKLQIDTHVQEVGVNALGNMAAPTNFIDVGWYKYGPSPGEAGSAVMAGHLDNGFGYPAVFKDLEKLKEGDVVTVAAKEGTEITFIVRSVRAYPYQETPREILFSNEGSPRITLITCGGTWLWDRGTYDQRIVVVAELSA